jgi:hypothetical protein
MRVKTKMKMKAKTKTIMKKTLRMKRNQVLMEAEQKKKLSMTMKTIRVHFQK